MTRSNREKAVSSPTPVWISSLGIALGGGVLLGGSLLAVAATEASSYKGYGPSGVYDLLVWGFPLAGISAAGLILLIVFRAILNRIGARQTIRGQADEPAQIHS